MLDKYQNMDELKADIEHMKPFISAEEYELIQYACGLLENQGVCEEVDIQGQQIKIDKYIIPIIKDLNQRGIITLACCSGLYEEHTKAKYKPEGQGYICLKYNQSLYEEIQNRAQGRNFSIEKSKCYFQDCIRIHIADADDKVLKEKWNSIWEILKDLSYNI